jgi:hypothetical protein
MKRKGFLHLALLLGCLTMVVGGCQQWALSVEPGDMTYVPGRPMEVRISAKMTFDIAGPNGITARPFAVPDPITIEFAAGETWTRARIERQGPDQYVYIFTGILDKPAEYYMVNPRTGIVNSRGRGAGPYELRVHPQYELGLKAGRRHWAGELPTYRMVVQLHSEHESELDIEAFLAGFAAAYAETGEAVEGNEYADLLRDCLEGRIYSLGLREGQRHVSKQVTSAYIQNLISRNVGSGSAALAWKAGYINGFAKVIHDQRGEDMESSLRLGETMYNSLKHGMGL